jgi:hypothetical protein
MNKKIIEIDKNFKIGKTILEKGDKIEILNEKGFEDYVDQFENIIRSMNDTPQELGANIAFAIKKSLFNIANKLPFFSKKDIPIITDSIVKKIK